MLALAHSAAHVVTEPGSSTRSKRPRLRVSRTRCGRWCPTPRIRSRQSGSWSATSANAAHQLGELLLHHQPAGRDDDLAVEQRARGVTLRAARWASTTVSGATGAELVAQPGLDRRGQQRDHVGARGEREQRLHAAGALRGRPVLLVDDHHVVRQELDRAASSAGCHRDHDVGGETRRSAASSATSVSAENWPSQRRRHQHRLGASRQRVALGRRARRRRRGAGP